MGCDMGRGVTISTVDSEEMINCLFNKDRKSPNSKTAPSNCNDVNGKTKALPAVGRWRRGGMLPIGAAIMITGRGWGDNLIFGGRTAKCPKCCNKKGRRA